MAEKIIKNKYNVTVKKYLSYNHNFWCKKECYLHQKHIRNSLHCINFYAIYGQNKYFLIDKQANFKMSDGNNIIIATTEKTKSFQ